MCLWICWVTFFKLLVGLALRLESCIFAWAIQPTLKAKTELLLNQLHVWINAHYLSAIQPSTEPLSCSVTTRGGGLLHPSSPLPSTNSSRLVIFLPPSNAYNARTPWGRLTLSDRDLVSSMSRASRDLNRSLDTAYTKPLKYLSPLR